MSDFVCSPKPYRIAGIGDLIMTLTVLVQERMVYTMKMGSDLGELMEAPNGHFDLGYAGRDARLLDQLPPHPRSSRFRRATRDRLPYLTYASARRSGKNVPPTTQ